VRARSFHPDGVAGFYAGSGHFAHVNTLIAALGSAIIARADWLGFRPVLVGGIHDPEFIKHP
jgi:hypothetical protein